MEYWKREACARVSRPLVNHPVQPVETRLRHPGESRRRRTGMDSLLNVSDGVPLSAVTAPSAGLTSELASGGDPVMPAFGTGGVDGDGRVHGDAHVDGDECVDGASDVRVLIVDDHADMLDMMQMMMERRCYRVAKAISGEQALEVARGFEPHVIVSDIGMPGMDGYEMMVALRAMDALSPFKSIALSGYDAQEEAPRAQAAGYDTQLTKPIDFESLFQAIDSLSPSA
jgi:CheY-like chemotaxis protein